MTSIALRCVRVWPRLLQPLAQSLIGSPGTLACSARKRPAKDGQEENCFRAWSFKPMRTIDPKNSNWKNWKNRCRIIRFESIFYDFCEFLRIFPKNQIRHRQKTGDDLEYVPLLFCHLVYTVSLLDTVEKWNQKQWNCIEWLIKGGPEPSILDDLCLGNVISKYFSKLRFGTSKIQPGLKCLENILLSFYDHFCGQNFENTSCLVFVHHSFPL